jgi:hypothetical protein
MEAISSMSETRNIWYESEIETLKKEIALVKEDAQLEILRLEKRNSEHQKLNGELQEKLSKYEDKAAHYRRKGVL